MASVVTHSVFTKHTDDIAVDEVKAPSIRRNFEAEISLDDISFSYEMTEDPKFHDLFHGKKPKQLKPH